MWTGLFRVFLMVSGLALGKSAAAQPPATPKKPVTETMHGVRITDDYRWLEQAGNPGVKNWLEEQNRFTHGLLRKNGDRPALQARLKELLADPAASHFGLQQRGGLLFALKNQPPKEQPFLVVLTSADAPESARVLLDPTAGDPKDKTTIDSYFPSRDGKLVAVILSAGGTEEGTLHVLDTATGKKLPDQIPRVSYPTAGGCLAWAPDGGSFYYTRYPAPGERAKEDLTFHQQVHHHKIGAPLDQDRYVLGKGLPRIAEIFLDLSPDGSYLLATVQKGDGGEFEHHLRGPNGDWTKLTQFSDQINAVAFGAEKDPHLYLLSRKNAPLGKIMKLPLEAQTLDQAKEFAPEGKLAIAGLDWRGTRMVPSHVPVATGVYVLEVDGGPSQLRFLSQDGSAPVRVPVPPVSAVYNIVPGTGDEILLQVGSYTQPPAWFRYRPGDTALRKTPLVKKAAASFEDVEVTRLFVRSQDKTMVPITLLHRKGLKLDGKNPTLLYAYGGYGVTLAPNYAAARRLWLDQGGVYAIANIRGGGEYGAPWHQAAMLTKRQNAYDDFLACAQILIDAGYTSPGKLAIEGASNGGLLMGAALTQKPDLFQVVVAHVGIFDMLRFELHPNGAFNTTEFGSVKIPEQFQALHAYSPLHRVKDGTAYPAVLLLTGANDGRVDPANSYKMAARLQAATSSHRPILLRVTMDSGHGLGENLSAGLDQAVDVHAFLLEQLGMKMKK